MRGFFVEKLIASGPNKIDSVISFCKGLNIIHGKSDSGKTIAANSIAYAMGGSTVPFSSDVSGGYDAVSIVLRASSNRTIRITRKIGKDKAVVESDVPGIKSGEYNVSASQNSPSINDIFLKLIGLNYTPMIGKNANSEKVKLTWKNLMRALYLDKETMGKSSFVIEPQNSYERTPLLSVLLFLIYGQDFSEDDPQTKATIRKAQCEAKLSYVSEKKDEYARKKQKADETVKSLSGNISKKDIDGYSDGLAMLEERIKQAIQESSMYYSELQDKEEQLRENQILLDRYEILKSQYVADVKRLNSIVEGNVALSSVDDSEKCPFCDSPIPIHKQSLNKEIATNELKTIMNLLGGLETAEVDTREKIAKLQQKIDDLKLNKKICDDGVEKELKPLASSIKAIISSYEESIVAEQNLKLYNEMIAELEADMALLEEEEKTGNLDYKRNRYKPKEFFNEDLINSLTTYAKEILERCRYSNFNEAAFDLNSFDIQINGVDKSLVHGQGYCSLFNSVLFLVFRECFYRKAKYNPGFLMIDTPLLGLVEKIGEPDPQNQKKYLYQYLASHTEGGQIIILDNTNELPGFLYKRENISVIEFSEASRKGFFVDYNRANR